MSFSLTLAVFKVNSGGESITSFEIDNPTGMAEAFWKMPEANLYMVCISQNKAQLRDVKAGIAVLTSLKHTDSDFSEMLMASARRNSVLSNFVVNPDMSMQPARLTLVGELPSEDELKGVFFQQYLKHSSYGSS